MKKKVNWWNTSFGPDEKNNLLRAFKNKSFTSGKENIALENNLKKLFKSKYCILCNSGTSALIMSLLALDIKSGDEVIVPNFTWIATANAAALIGAKIKLVDSHKDNPVLDEKKILKLVSSKTKAIITVNFHGRSCEYKKLNMISKKYKIPIIEDNCKGIGGFYNKKNLGTFGIMGCHSLGMISLLPVGFGGFIVTNNKLLEKKLKLIRDNGVDRSKNDEKLSYLGANFKISDLLVSLANAQIKKIKIKINKLLKIYRLYENNLNNPNITFLPINVNNGEIPLCIDLYSKYRNQIRKYLQKNGFDMSNFHMNISESNLVSYKNKKKLFPNSYSFSNYGFSPPCGPAQKLKDINKVIELLNKWKP